jgi:hypothetical protein
MPIDDETPKSYSETKHEVFISSPWKDMEDIRMALIVATSEYGLIPCAMEYFSNSGESSSNLDKAEKFIRRSDIFALALGPYYGTELSNGKSFTQYEFEYAKKYNKPMIILLLSHTKAKEIRNRPDNKDKEHEEKYWDFRKQFENPSFSPSVTHFNDMENVGDIKFKYTRDLGYKIKDLKEKGGWKKPNSELMSEIISSLNSYGTLGDRTKKNSDLKEAIARLFIREYLPTLIARNYRNFFFESGSSIAFVAKEFTDYYKESYNYDWTSSSEKLVIETNNVLAYEYFLLKQKRDKLCTYPQGIPRDKYGASYGDLERYLGCKWHLFPDRKEDFSITEYLEKNHDIKEQLKKITEKFDRDYTDNAEKISVNGIVFMAASGLGKSEYMPEGPHVKSFINMLFKNSILSSKCPTVLFLDQTKFHGNLKGRYSACDDIFTWEDVCKGNITKSHLRQDLTNNVTKPFAIAFGMRDDPHHEGHEIKDKLRDLSLKVLYCNKIQMDNKEVYGLIMANDSFMKIIDKSYEK